MQGQCCRVERRAHDWAFRFGDGSGLGVSVPWRIIQAGRIAFANSDDGQVFGLSAPIDGEARANMLLQGLRVIDVEIDGLTADLHLRLEGELRIDVFNHSSGYEGWQGWYASGPDTVTVIGLGGGGIAVF
jgi:hypothetical protein